MKQCSIIKPNYYAVMTALTNERKEMTNISTLTIDEYQDRETDIVKWLETLTNEGKRFS